MDTLAPRLNRAALSLACLLTLATVGAASGAAAQATDAPAPDPLDLMREDLAARRYDEVLRRGNQLLGSSRAFTVAEQTLLWQVMAAAYYPPDVMAQRPDSARLPLEALVRMAPDVELRADLRWAGLDSLLERSRASVFAVAARPQAEYQASLAQPAFITAVASRPARFRLISVNVATGVATLHDSSAAVRSTALRLRVHDGLRPLIADGAHVVQVVAVDARTGDSLVVGHRAEARVVSRQAIAPIPAFIPPARVREAGARRGSMLLGGLAFAGATYAIADRARAAEPIRSGYSTDTRAMVVGGAMVVAAVTGFFLDRGRSRPANADDIARARAEYDRRVAGAVADSRAGAQRYRVLLTIDPEAR